MHGLSTLNRLLGKKNKEASRSTTNLSKSTNNLDTSSQHNRISPIVSNAPFEQTFRVTVYLPKKQLYVERIGAKTKLATLMDKICENKHLTADKYEFRHPGDMAQCYDNDKTIGEVGLNELKLVLKTESRFNSDFHRFHADDMMKYKSSVPDSVSSSEISRNYNKNPMQKASPYSSTTSLNSLDSTGMNLTAKTQPPVAPARKKRAAPRPPSQNSIPEQEIFGTTLNVFKEPHSILPRKNFHVSSPQLFNNINNNGVETRNDKNNNHIDTGNRLNAITRPTSLFVTSTTEINGSDRRQRSPSESSEVQQILHERQNSGSLEKKKKPAPVPPKRAHKPVPSPRTVQDEAKTPTITEIMELEELESSPQFGDKIDHVSNGNVSKTMLNNATTPDDLPSVESSDGPISIQIISSDSSIEHIKEEPTTSPKLPAVSKVHIKLEEERRSSSEDEMTVNIYNVTKSVVTLEKQSNSVGNPAQVQFEMCSPTTKVPFEKTPSPVMASYEKPPSPVKVPFEKAPTPVKAQFESFSKPAKTPSPPPVKTIIEASPPPAPKSYSSSAVFNLSTPVKARTPSPPPTKENIEIKKTEIEVEQRATSPLWTYTLPAPPVFADSSHVENHALTDHQKGGEKFFSDIVSTGCNETILSDSNTTVISTETQIHPVIVNRKSLDDSFIMTPKDYTKQADDASDKSTEIITSDLEDGYLGNGKVINIESPPPVMQTFREENFVIDDFKRSRLLIARSDSFHSIGQGRSFDAPLKRSPVSPPQRSISFLSLVQTQKAEMRSNRSSMDNAPYSRQKSNSELSIVDVPSLQSLEVMKNILNSSRKNSLQDPEPKEEKVVIIHEIKKESPPPQIKLEEVVKKMEEIAMKPERKSPPVVEVKPAETQWRYSGPPKINLGTWNERPKVEVAIAADRDYKFGRVSTTVLRDHQSQDNASKRHTIHISNERFVKDEPVKFSKPKVLGVEYKKDVSPPHVVREREPSVEIVTKPTRTFVNITPRPMSMDMSNNYSTIVTSTSSTTPSSVSYNRLNSNAKKFTPVVRGFKLNNIKEGGDQVDHSSVVVVVKKPEVYEKRVVEPPSVPTKPSFLRSTSAGDINRNMKFSIVESKPEDDSVTSSDTSPFSQFGLRKTGLKEKILLSDKDTKSIFGKVVEPKHESFIRNQQSYEAQPEIHVEKVTMRSLSHPVPPKPPTAPPMMMNFRKSAPVNIDNRDQLLDAIKGFNKDSLRHK